MKVDPVHSRILADRVQIQRIDSRPLAKTITLPAGLPHTIVLRTDPLLTNQNITVTQPTNGTLTTPVNGIVTYTPNSLGVTSDSFTYQIVGSSAPAATVNLKFIAGNLPDTNAF